MLYTSGRLTSVHSTSLKWNVKEVLITFSLFILDLCFLDCPVHTSVKKIPHENSGNTNVSRPFKMNSH